mgnify:FL=1
MNIFKKLHKLIDLCIQAAEASIKGHNAAYESFTRADQYAYRYHQDHLTEKRKQEVALKAEIKHLESILRDSEQEGRYQILTAVANSGL